MISPLRGIILVVFGLFNLPLFFPELGVWTSALFAETTMAVLSVVLLPRFLPTLTEVQTNIALRQGVC